MNIDAIMPVVALAASALVLVSHDADAAQHYVGERGRVIAWTGGEPADRVRFGVRDDGVYAVSDAELAAAFGIPEDEVSRLLDCGMCRIESRGDAVPWERFAGGMRFYGLALPYEARAPENVYFATLGEYSAPMRSRPAAPVPDCDANLTFQSTKRIAEVYCNPSIDYCSRTNHSMLKITSLGASAGYKANISLPDVAAGNWTGTMTGRLYSEYENVWPDTHCARFSVQNTDITIAEAEWSGEDTKTFSGTFNSSVLVSGKLLVLLKNTAKVVVPDPSIFCWEYSDIMYQRYYRAVDDMLLCTGGAAANVRVSGFSGGGICAWDVTDPLSPVSLSGVAETAGVVEFSCGGTDCEYAVFSGAGCFRPSVRGVRDIDPAAPGNAAALVIVIPPEGWVDGFRTAMQTLADYRSGHGVPSAIVDVESIYNRYSQGIASTDAIRAFVAEAYARWTPRPRYLLLAGQGNDDFHHAKTGFQGESHSRCLIPPILMPIVAEGEGQILSADMLFGEVDGSSDGPEIAVGRFPAVTAAQASNMVSRTISYEMRRMRRQAAVAVSDYDVRSSVRFSESVGNAAATLASIGWRTSVIVPSDGDPTHSLYNERTAHLLPALAAGVGLFHYFGHSNYKALGNSTLPDRCLIDDTHLSSWSFPPVAVMLCCNVGMWHANSTDQCLSCLGMQAAAGGFAATVSPTGVTLDSVGERFADAFYRFAERGGTLRLGDAWRDAVALLARYGYPMNYYAGIGLLGDPAIIFRPDRPSYGWFMILGQPKAKE